VHQAMKVNFTAVFCIIINLYSPSNLHHKGVLQPNCTKKLLRSIRFQWVAWYSTPSLSSWVWKVKVQVGNGKDRTMGAGYVWFILNPTSRYPVVQPGFLLTAFMVQVEQSVQCVSEFPDK